MGLEQNVGANVRRLRKALGLTQEQLAHEMGITTRYVGMIERADTSVTIGMLEKLAGVLMVPAESLLTRMD